MRKKILLLLLATMLVCNAIKLSPLFEYAVNDAHSNMITTISFYNDGSRFVTGSKDHTVKVWSMTDFSNLYSSSDVSLFSD